MNSIFGSKKTPAELFKQYKRNIDRTIRELEREAQRMQMQEKKIIAEMKQNAKKNQMDAVKIMAKDLVRTRRYVTKFYRMKAQMQAVSLRLQTLKSTAEMTKAMAGVTKAMHSMNSRMNLPAMNKIMQQFAKENEIMDMKEEMMSDVMDDIFADADDEEEESDLVNQVLDEIGLNVTNMMGATPSKRVGVAGAAAAEGEQTDGEHDDLAARLENLKK